MSKRQAEAQPFPFEIWLKVDLTNVPQANRRRVKSTLTNLRGFSTGMDGEESVALRYTYAPRRVASIPTTARQTLRHAGATRPRIDGFIVWRLDLNFRTQPDENAYGHMIRAMKALPEVLDVHGLGNNRAGVYVEFKGQPSAETVDAIRVVAGPAM